MPAGEYLKIGEVGFGSPFFLAPMAGYGDAAFRSACRGMGAAYSVSEMVSAKALCFGDEKTKELLTPAENEKPFGVQIFGSEPETMARGAKLALEISGADILDINMGCPARKITSCGEGSALMKDILLAEKIISAVKKAVKTPVTIKFRAGFDGAHINAPEFAKMAENAGADGLCIHARTADMMYSGSADHAVTARVVSAVKIPVIANGDVTSAYCARKILYETGAAAVMIGRGALGNPWIFRECTLAAAGLRTHTPTLLEKLEMFLKILEAAAEKKGEFRACREARAHFCHYLKGVRNAARYKNLAVGILTLQNARELVEKILSEQAGEDA